MPESPTDPEAVPDALRGALPELEAEPDPAVAPARGDGGRAAVLLLVGLLAGLVVAGAWERVRGDRGEAEIGAVRALIEQSHVHPPGESELVEGAVRGMLSALDPYSRLYDRAERARLERETTGLYTGIGVVFAPVELPWTVLFPLPGGPAERAGVRVGERIAALDGRPVEQLGEGELRGRLSDAGAGQVTLALEDRSGNRRAVLLRPEPVVDPTVRHALLLDPARGLGYVALTAFSRRTVEEFDAALDELSELGLRGLVLDLRGNLGGVLESAVEVANRFVPEGALLVTESRGGREVTRARRDAARLADLPLVVLVDRHTASASEVLAGALQDHRAAVLVGERTYGKGTVQTLTPLPWIDGVAKITTAVYRTPAGRLIERSLPGQASAGLAPDVLVEAGEAERDALRGFLEAYGPRPARAEELRAWELECACELLPEPPRDAALAAALDLLAGRRPGVGPVARR